MSNDLKKVAITILSVGTLIAVATISINLYLKNKVQSFITDRLPENMIQSYDDITVESFGGSLAITNASLIITNKEDSLKHTYINVDKLKISHISYWDYIFKEEIHIETISVINPIMAYYKDRVVPKQNSIQKGVIDIYKPIFVNKLIVNNSKFAIYEKGKDSTKLYTKGLSLNINGIKVDKNTIKQKIPFDYKTYQAKGDSLFVKVSPYENATVSHFSIKNNDAEFKNIQLKTKYSKQQLSQIIKTERDHYNLTLPSLTIESIGFGFDKKEFYAKSKFISLTSPTVKIYRDKLVADDPKIKPLYSQMLRELPFALTVDSLNISNAKITYEERVNRDNMGGSIKFENLNAQIANASNTYSSPQKTRLQISADFMGNTPLAVDWSFDVNDKTDAFIFKADMGALQAEKMNSFTQPNLNVKLEGHTNKTYFTIDGNSESATTDMKISYSNFKVNILKKNGKEKNSFFSAIANIFVSQNSKSDEDSFKEGTATATRDKTKSIFNFLWISVKAALEKIIV